MKFFLLVLFMVQLIACSGSGSSSNDESLANPIVENDESTQQGEDDTKDEEPNATDGEEPADSDYIDLQALALNADEKCNSPIETVNEEALMKADCPLLSQYGLFKDIQKPHQSFNDTVTPYDLSVELFSDYARKYRAVYVPNDKVVGFDYNDAFDFPEGSVLIKTFSMPSDTSNPDFSSERLIETRLLIKRANGWRGLPYQWVNNGEDAILAKYGALVEAELIHLEQVYQFKYEIPANTTCKTCHQNTLDDNSTLFSPIGVKARFLNWAINFGDEKTNQLIKWRDLGYFGEFNPDVESIDTVPNFGLVQPVSNKVAKGYLDVNCAHCHQEGGQGGLSGLRLEYWRPATGINHGICKTPPGFDGGDNNLHYDIVPGKADESILPYRMSHLSAKDMMPPLGRATVHLEGVELIRYWINAMETKDCGT